MSGLFGFLGVVIGALAVVSAGLLVEDYKRHRDRQGTASALAGEIQSILHMTEKRNYVLWFTRIATELESGLDVTVPDIGAQPGKLDPIVDRHIDRLGLLSGDVPERLAIFYSALNGIRLDLFKMASGKLDTGEEPQQVRGRKAVLIREDLSLWDETEPLGKALVTDLRKIAGELWQPEAVPLTLARACWRGVRGLLRGRQANGG
ncbi:MAG: hypothetical protein WCF16_10580 [Alphaproteobacteria bacterium]